MRVVYVLNQGLSPWNCLTVLHSLLAAPRDVIEFQVLCASGLVSISLFSYTQILPPVLELF